MSLSAGTIARIYVPDYILERPGSEIRLLVGMRVRVISAPSYPHPLAVLCEPIDPDPELMHRAFGDHAWDQMINYPMGEKLQFFCTEECLELEQREFFESLPEHP